ncbi:glycosyltransferase [Robiginitalea sp. SC105]|uniref:glycosyltransferase n=1 Tax=Robiginitalea sp. SC105 TaxID=2762332 RepID=UPI001639DD6D|nr:glycosyltransferase [Robiginitalea sp. SC105]MBC2838235.1 glycosyltransferase [Robiginitalea sp. SC105]
MQTPEKLHILLISNMFPSKKDPLFGIFVKNFKTKLEELGVQFPSHALIRGKSGNPFRKFFIYLLHYLRILRAALGSNYDLIYVHYLMHHIPILWLLLTLKKKPLVVNVHGSDIVELPTSGFLWSVSQSIMRKIDLLIVPTTYFQHLVIARYPFLEQSKVFISPSGGIDAKRFFPTTREPGGPFVLGYVSRFIREKGWETFLDALELLLQSEPQYRAVIAGKGPDEEKIKKHLSEHKLGDRVDFLGLVPQKDLGQVYGRMDLFVFPSYRKAESLGLTGLEAMACGVPVVACESGGPMTYIREKQNGYLFEPQNAKDLYQKILQYRSIGSKEREHMRRECLETAKYFDDAAVAKRLYKRLEQLI